MDLLIVRFTTDSTDAGLLEGFSECLPAGRREKLWSDQSALNLEA